MATNNTTLVTAVHKLAIAGKRGGFTLEQMIQLLNTGMSVDALVEVIGFYLSNREENNGRPAHSSLRWTM